MARAILIMDWHLGLTGRRGRSRRIRVLVSWMEGDGIDKVVCSILHLHVSVDFILGMHIASTVQQLPS